MRQVIAELRFALRVLMRRPGHSLAVVLTLALGIGANVAIFSVIQSLLFEPLPYPQDAQLVTVYDALPKSGTEHGGSSVPDYLDERAQADALADLALYQSTSYNLSANGTPDHVRALRATPSLFSTLGVAPLLGRAFSADEGTPGNDRVVVLGYAAWQSRFGADANVVGRDVRMDGADYRIVGVMPRGFYFPDADVQVWTPYPIGPEQSGDAQRGHSDTLAVGRLKPGMTRAVLEAQFRAIAQRNAERSAQLKADYAATGFTVHAQSLREDWFGSLRPALWLLQGMVVLVLAITCANAANLMIVRYTSRRREFALRAALGARGRRIAVQVMFESTLLALCGGVLGAAFARAVLPLIGLSGLDTTLRAHQVEPALDASALLLVLLLALGLGLLLGGVNAAALRRARAFDQLRSSGQAAAATRASGAIRNGLVVAQLALAVILLTGAGLLLESFRHLLGVSPGFASDAVVTARLNLPRTAYADGAARSRYYQRVLDNVRAISGVSLATYTSSLPFGGHLGTSGFAVEGYSGADADSLEAQRQSVDEDYFSALQIPLLEGRAFRSADDATAAPVVIVDALLARHLWPGRSALGQHLRIEADQPWQTVVGVAASVQHRDLADLHGHDAMYWPYRQHPVDFGYLVVKSALPAAVISAALRNAVLAADPELPAFDIRPLDARVRASLDDRRAPMLLLSVLSVLGLLVAAIGIYGVLAFAVALRTGEIGVRLSLGAQRRDILRLILRDGGRLTAVGLLLGLIGAVAIALTMRAQLFGIGVFDPLTLAGVVAVIAATAFIACWLPARRAARIAPTEALRYE